MFRKELNYPLINFTLFMFLIFIGITNLQFIMKFFQNILSIFLPFLLGFIAAYAINPFVVFLEKKTSRSISIVLVIGGILFLLGFLIFTIFPILYQQIVGFTIQVLEVLNQLSKKIPISSSKLGVSFTHFFNQILQSVGSFTTDMTFQAFGGVFQGVSQFIIGFISFIYFLVYMKKIRAFFQEVLRIRHPKIYRYLLCLDFKMIQYVKSLGMMMLFQFLEYSFLFFLIGHPHFLVLGILIGLFTIIPYFGGLLASFIAIVSAFMISKNLFYATLFVCFVFPIVDEYLISPKIYGKTNQISPVVTILVFSVGGSVGGILGIILAIPVYVFIRTTIIFFLDDAKNGIQYMKNSL